MLEPTAAMTYKAIIHITQAPRSQDQTKLFDVILSYIADYLSSRFSITFDSPRFVSGQTYKAEQDGYSIRSAPLFQENGAQEPVQWAVSVRCRDVSNKRRNWINHIGLEQQDDGSFILYYAEYCAVHQAGSIVHFKTPASAPPVLLKMLMGCRSLCCFSGVDPLVYTPWHLVETGIEDFVSILYDTKRTVPIVLITCPELVDTRLLVSKTLGNVSVYCMDDYKTHALLCKELPVELCFSWGAIKIYMPFGVNRTYHFTIPYQDVAELGSEGITDAIYRAFCTCLTGDERRAFVSLDCIYETFKQRNSDKLKAQAAALSEECQRLRAANEQLVREQSEMSAELTSIRDRLEQSDVLAYEELISEASNEVSQLKHGLSILTERLYADPKEEISAEGLECDALRDLAMALRTFQALSINHRG